MPKIKTKRSDILRKREILETVKKAEEKEMPWLSCMIGLACIFGKRINEIINLRKDQILTDDKFLIVRFRVSKKRDRDTPIPIYHLKRKTLKHPLVPFILKYVKSIEDGYLFPSEREESMVKQKITVTTKAGESKELQYEYVVPGGFLSRQLALYYLKKIAPNWWWHLCRESLATSMAEDGATEEELMHWFDWETPNSPHKYVKRGTKLTEKWSERTW